MANCPMCENKTSTSSKKSWLISVIIFIVIILVFALLNKLGISALVNINSNTSLIMILGFGLLAGFSTCSATTGSLVLLLPKDKISAHILFNLGRLLIYLCAGILLGLIGQQLQISPIITAIFMVIVSLAMIFFALRMLGFSWAQKIKFNWFNKAEKQAPFIMGLLTILLPCGFTLSAESLALISGSALRGLLIMALFIAGTLPALILISLASIKLSQKPMTSYNFTRVAGLIIIFFALFNLSNQSNILWPKANAKNVNSVSQTQNLPPIIDGVQVIKMTANASGYSPKYFQVRANVPVRWEITDEGASGCTNALIAPALFNQTIKLWPGQTSVAEFTPKSPGSYKFSCIMGMVTGIIEVTI